MKPIKMWAVFTPEGDMVRGTIGGTENWAKVLFVANVKWTRSTYLVNKRFEKYGEQGYTVRPVWVSEEAPDGR